MAQKKGNKKTTVKKKSVKASLYAINSAEDVPLDKDMPATKGHFDAFRAEITSRITSVELLVKTNNKKNEIRFNKIDQTFKKIDARFDKIDAKLEEIDAKFDKIDAKFERIDKKFEEIDARFERIEKDIRGLNVKISEINIKMDRMVLLAEEQNNRNKLVMDALINLFNRQDALEKRVDERFKTLEDAIKGI